MEYAYETILRFSLSLIQIWTAEQTFAGRPRDNPNGSDKFATCPIDQP